MKDVPVSEVRNVVLMGHTGSGKTSLADALLFKLGINDRLGSPENGTSMADWTDEEKARKITLTAKAFDGVLEQDGRRTRWVFLDTPGYLDFFGQVIAASAVADAGLIVVDAASGLQIGSHRAWRRCEELRLPRAVIISGIDKENVDWNARLAEVREAWGPRCLPVAWPSPGGAGVTDVMAADAGHEEHRAALVEAAAETDDALIEKYLGGEEIPPEDVQAGLRSAVRSCALVPVLALSVHAGQGVDEMLHALRALLPSPLERAPVLADGGAVDPSPEAPLRAQVWKTMVDPFVGQLSFVRIWGGTMKGEGELHNITRDAKERSGGLYLVRGRKQEPAGEAQAGDIVALAKLKHTRMNDTFGVPGDSAGMPPIVFPHPVVQVAVTPKTQGDEDKLGSGLQRLCEEDPTLQTQRHPETHELILEGMGDVHIDVAIERLRKRSGVEVELRTPRVPYKETITASGEGHYRHKKQSGGRGQYGEVFLRVAPLGPDEEEWFSNDIVGGAIPSNFIPAVQKGLVEGMQRGPIAGCPVTRVKVSVYDGSYHDVDSSEIAFKIAGARALRDGLSKAKPVLLEPIMKVRVVMPDAFMGDVTGDLNHRRGRILGMEADGGMQTLSADVPQAEMFQYCSQLRSITGGQGSFEMEFSRYEAVPANVAQKIMAEARREQQEEE